MNELEKLLAQLKAEYTQKEQPQQPLPVAPPSPEKLTRSPLQSPSPIDNLLAEVKAEIENPRSSLPQSLQSTDSKSQVFKHQDKPLPDNQLLEDVKAEYREQERLEQQRKQQELIEQQRLEEQRRQRRRQALKQQAQEWLKNLNPRSEEGIWFEEFSYSYDSKLEAAIDYLEALRESQRK
jgi:hypothetical protein